MKPKPRFETLAIKSVEMDMGPITPVSSPIYLSSTYTRSPDGSFPEGLIYSRNDNPNRLVLEKSMATLERGAHAFAFSSGMAAIAAVFQSLSPRDHILLPDDIYYAIRKLMNDVLQRWKLEYSFVDMSEPQHIREALQPNTKLIWIETPSNPMLKVTDIPSIVGLAEEHNIMVAVDNTWSTPVIRQPLTLGATLVVHSSTKYLGGHSDVVGGCVITNDSKLAERIKSIQVLSGAVPSPFDCWLISRGIQTLHLRITKQSQNALALAQWLDGHPKVKKVYYPGISSHPGHEDAIALYGGMLSIQLKGDAKTCMKLTNALAYFKTATSLGGVESLIEHRRSVEGPTSNTPDNLLRISVGIEHIDDLIGDWKNALETV